MLSSLFNSVYNAFSYPSPIIQSQITKIQVREIEKIFSHLNLESIIACSQVDKSWNQLTFDSLRKLIIEKPQKRYKALNSRLNDDREVLLAMVEKTACVLLNASKRFTNDKDFMLEAIQKNHKAIAFTDSLEIKNNKELILYLIDKSSDCFKYATESLKGDRGFVSDAIRINASIFQYASKEIQNDKQFIMENMVKSPRLCLNVPMSFFKDCASYEEFVTLKENQSPILV